MFLFLASGPVTRVGPTEGRALTMRSRSICLTTLVNVHNLTLFVWEGNRWPNQDESKQTRIEVDYRVIVIKYSYLWVQESYLRKLTCQCLLRT